jgi:hypothetical protein
VRLRHAQYLPHLSGFDKFKKLSCESNSQRTCQKLRLELPLRERDVFLRFQQD